MVLTAILCFVNVRTDVGSLAGPTMLNPDPSGPRDYSADPKKKASQFWIPILRHLNLTLGGFIWGLHSGSTFGFHWALALALSP